MTEEHALQLLNQFIAAASELGAAEIPCIKPKPITAENEDNLFLEKISKFEKGLKDISDTKQDEGAADKYSLNSIVHSGDTDSSDDEERRDFESRKYNEYGRDIRKLLPEYSSSTSTDSAPSCSWKPKIRNESENRKLKSPTKQAKPKAKLLVETNVYTDPIFGLRLLNPLISSITLQERMKGRTPVPLSRMKLHVSKLNPDDDWVFAGTIVSKVVKTSQKGNQFSIWTISDLHNDLKTVALFLFSSAHKNLWKTVQGTVVGVLNPTVMEQKEKSTDEATLSVNNSDRIMIMGQSKDLGTCRSQKKSGDPCTAFVNKNRCEYCIYHVKSEYQKFSGRSDLQSSFVGGGLKALRNKVLGKNEVFYAGKSYTAVKAPSKRSSQKLRIKDEGILEALSSGVRVNTNINVRAKNLGKGAANKLDVSVNQRKKDLELLQKLCAGPKAIEEVPSSTGKRTSRVAVSTPGKTTKTTAQYDRTYDLFSGRIEAKKDFDGTVSNTVTLSESKNTALDVIAKLKAKKASEKQENVSLLKDQTPVGLFCNKIETKKEFDETTSKPATLSESKNTAISKLKANKVFNNTLLNDVKDTVNDASAEHNLWENLDYDSDDVNSDEFDILPESVKTAVVKETSKNESSNAVQKFIIETPANTKMSELAKVAVESKIRTIQPPPKITENASSKSSLAFDIPLLSGFSGKSTIDLNAPVSKSHVNRAKLNAITYIQRHGPIAKVDPMKITAAKRKRPSHPDISTPAAKKLKEIQENEFMTQRFKKIMAASSKHSELLQEIDDDERDKYFNKMEIKEKMEEKMLETFKVNCKAVRCLKCKYTSFSASDRCKAEKHPLKVYDTVKRFFKCNNCGNRTVSLTVVPMESCQKCSSGKWERCAMIAERNVKTLTQLSIRGGEERYVGGAVTNANINLMVPDDGAS